MKRSETPNKAEARRTRLQGAAALFVATWIVHTADHARRGVGATTDAVVWVGTFVALVAAVSITLIAVRHPTAPAIAAAVFPAIAIGVTASHMLPDWGVLSDPLLVDSASDGWSIAAVSSEIVGAALLGAVAFGIMRRNGYAWTIPAEEWATPRQQPAPA